MGKNEARKKDYEKKRKDGLRKMRKKKEIFVRRVAVNYETICKQSIFN